MRLLTIRPFRSFTNAFPDEAACRAALADARWPDGFICPACGHDDAAHLAKRHVWQCRACRRQTSVTAGTALHATKLPLRKWLFACWCYVALKGELAATQLKRRTRIGSYRTAWAMLQKLRIALDEGPMQVDGATRELLCAALPDHVLDKKARGSPRARGLLVVVGRHTRATVVGPPARETSCPRACSFLDRVVAVLDHVHAGVSSTYVGAYVRGLSFVARRRPPGAALHALLGKVVQARHCSIARVRAVGIDGELPVAA